MSDDVTAYKLVRDKRRALGLSQRRLAEAVGVTRSVIANIENRRCRASWELVQRVLSLSPCVDDTQAE